MEVPVVAALALALTVVLAGGMVVVMRRRHGDLPRRSTHSDPHRIDPFAVGEPWMHHVANARAAQSRFQKIVAACPDGPLRPRLTQIGLRVDIGVGECWKIARSGNLLDATIREVDGATLQGRLDRAGTDREAVSLRAQLAALDRMRDVRSTADTTLRVLQTRLGEIVVRATELHLNASTGGRIAGSPAITVTWGATGELGAGIEEIVVELEALRTALDEIDEPFARFHLGAGDGPDDPRPGRTTATG